MQLARPRWLAALGLVVCFVAVLDPACAAGALLGVLLVVTAFFWQRRRTGARWPLLPGVTLALALAVAANSEPQYLRADFTAYYSHLRSLFFDHDLDFRNEAEALQMKPQPLTPVGRFPIYNATIGAALLWSPFYIVAHLYVMVSRLLGLADHATDGYGIPYFSSVLAGTVTFAVLGAWALGSVIARRLPSRVAALAVVAAVGASPILFYIFVQPGMVHGLIFALVCLAIRAADDADREPSWRRWVLLGFLCGLIALVRPQAALFSLAVVPLAARGLVSRRIRPWWLVGGAAAVLFALVPQLLAWKYVYGQWLPLGGPLESWSQQLPAGRETFFRYSTWFDPRALHLSDVLFSAQSGLFSLHPALLLGLAALPFALRRFGWLAVGGLLVFVVTAWFNGSLATPDQGDTFGGRRFDVVVPFAALGFAVLLDACAKQPLVAPAALVGLFVLWNVGLIGLYRQYAIPLSAPLERVARGQARQLRGVVEGVLGTLCGPAGRAFAYRLFVGEYFFWNAGPNGTIDLSDVDSPYLAGGWSGPVNREGPPRFRTALYPRSCVRFPLMVAVGLDVTVTARAPARLTEQTMSVSLNGNASPALPLASDWSERTVSLPREWALAGPNLLCLEFAQGKPRGGEEDTWAAHVRSIKIRSQSPTTPTPVWGVHRSQR